MSTSLFGHPFEDFLISYYQQTNTRTYYQVFQAIVCPNLKKNRLVEKTNTCGKLQRLVHRSNVIPEV